MDSFNQRSARPSINRGASAPTPIYQRRHPQPSYDVNDPQMRLGLSRVDESGSAASSGAAITDTVRRTLGSSEVTASTSSRPMLSPALALPSLPSSTTTSTAAPSATSSSAPTPAQGLFTPPQTPSATSRLPSAFSTPRIIDSDSTAPVPPATYFPMTSYQPTFQQQPPPPLQPQPPSSAMPSWTPMAPSVSGASSSSITPSQLRRQSPQAEIKMEIESSPTSHTLLAPLGNKFTSDAITIAAKKNNVLQIMADRWDQEKDCGRGGYRVVAGYS
ncbi:hypothetical protein FRB90_004586 [Tulasnella sp. 427]|nr:hypothetical protein FRB90_004586 [Tulasnella sp. 427]